MFRKRRSSQKPGEDFYAAFKHNFASLAPWSSSTVQGPGQHSSSLSEALIDADLPINRQAADQDHNRDQEIALKEVHDTYRFTPSVMDPNSVAFSAFANQLPGYYTPATSGDVGTLYRSQAGDLHTPGMGMTVGTPLSLPQATNALCSADLNLPSSHYHPHMLHPHQFESSSAYPIQQVFAPTSFLQHQDSGYEAISPTPNHSSPRSAAGAAKVDAGPVDPMIKVSTPSDADTATIPSATSAGTSFRYHCTLNAPTAMIKHAGEIPVSYLNKGQAYSLAIVDTMPTMPTDAAVRHRTYVRISFEDEDQRSKPGTCWQLWKEGRGTNEAHQREGKLLAVEYVDTSQGGDQESRRPQVELQHNSFDGFCVTWSTNPVNGRPDCSISVRFNFLSTDFSHSKGVKGIPVRLCAKTHTIPVDSTGDLTELANSPENHPEVCYAKVKLFRDHGAERKLANDVAHVKKSIEKFKQQIAQAEAGMPTFGKRRRSGGGSTVKPLGKGPGKTIKDKRTWSLDSDPDAPTHSTITLEEDLVMKLGTVQDMFSSTRPVSLLYLRGEREDDPDLFPIHLPSDQNDPASPSRLEPPDSKTNWADTPVTSNLVSPTLSSNTILSPLPRAANLAPLTLPPPPPPPPPPTPSRFASPSSGRLKISLDEGQSSRSSTTQYLSGSVPHQRTGASGSTLNVMGINTDYYAPPHRSHTPAACFYVRRKDSPDPYYRAIYLMQRTVQDLIRAISDKFQMDPTSICRVTHLNSRGLCIVVDEEVVRELPEEQDMIVELSKSGHEQPVKTETSVPSDGDALYNHDLSTMDPLYSDGFEMWLDY